MLVVADCSPAVVEMKMNLALSPDLQKFVDDKVRSGRYGSPEEVVRDALVLLKAQDDLTEDDLADLRQMLAPAIAQADRGELTPLDMDDIKRTPTRSNAELR